LVATLFAATITTTANAEIYKWTDADGRVHFGDARPVDERFEEVTVQINSYEAVTFENWEGEKTERAEKVVMYTTSWCGYCAKARKYFTQNKISFVEYDIERDLRAKKRYDALGAKGVPVILVGRARMNGFSESGFRKIYDR